MAPTLIGICGGIAAGKVCPPPAPNSSLKKTLCHEIAAHLKDLGQTAVISCQHSCHNHQQTPHAKIALIHGTEVFIKHPNLDLKVLPQKTHANIILTENYGHIKHILDIITGAKPLASTLKDEDKLLYNKEYY